VPPEVRWRIDDGEEARLTPEGPTAASIASRGPFPFLRARSPGQPPLRPAFPGSCVSLADGDFEVVEAREQDGGALYLLEPWPAGHVRRDRFAYGPGLVRRARALREAEERARRARRFSLVLLPLLGSLPEPLQRTQAERLGFDPPRATQASALVELTAGLLLAFTAGSVGPAALLIAPGALRLLAASVTGDVAGQWLVTLPLRLAGAAWQRLAEWRPGRPALARDEFWRRLARPDALEPQADGSVVVAGALPHLTWDGVHVLESNGERWRPEGLGLSLERGRPVYRYRLTPQSQAEPAGARRPSGNAYADEVRTGLQAEWDDVLRAFAGLVSLLPSDVQARAFGPRGGPAAARRSVFVSAAVEIAVAVYVLSFFPGPPGDPVGPCLGLLAVVTLGEALLRLKRAHEGGYAPSLWGRLLPPTLFRPERGAWERHRAAERAALDRLL